MRSDSITTHLASTRWSVRLSTTSISAYDPTPLHPLARDGLRGWRPPADDGRHRIPLINAALVTGSATVVPAEPVMAEAALVEAVRACSTAVLVQHLQGRPGGGR